MAKRRRNTIGPPVHSPGPQSAPSRTASGTTPQVVCQENRSDVCALSTVAGHRNGTVIEPRYNPIRQTFYLIRQTLRLDSAELWPGYEGRGTSSEVRAFIRSLMAPARPRWWPARRAPGGRIADIQVITCHSPSSRPAGALFRYAARTGPDGSPPPCGRACAPVVRAKALFLWPEEVADDRCRVNACRGAQADLASGDRRGGCCAHVPGRSGAGRSLLAGSATSTQVTNCGGGVSAVTVRPAAGFHPLTATPAQLTANGLPLRPAGRTELAAWRKFVTGGVRAARTTCGFAPVTPSSAPRSIVGDVKPDQSIVGDSKPASSQSIVGDAKPASSQSIVGDAKPAGSQSIVGDATPANSQSIVGDATPALVAATVCAIWATWRSATCLASPEAPPCLSILPYTKASGSPWPRPWRQVFRQSLPECHRCRKSPATARY